MQRLIWPLQKRIGRRGVFLLLTGFVWIFIGGSVITDHNVNPHDAILYQYLHPTVRGAMWITVGLFAMTTSLSRPRWDRWGFAALTLMPLQRVVGNVYGFIHYIVPEYPPGTLEAFWNILVWGTIALVIFVIAGWDDDVECEVPGERHDSMDGR